MIMRWCVAVVSALVVSQSAVRAASADHGKTVFMNSGCWECHGTLGQGSIATSNGKRIAPDPLPWEAFSGFVRSSNRAMPPFSEKILSESDLADIYAYLQSVPKPPANIPLLR
jgi:mono/diheme cytochrome c family protein